MIQAQMPECQASMCSIIAFLHGAVQLWQEGSDAAYGALQLWHVSLHLVLLDQQLA